MSGRVQKLKGDWSKILLAIIRLTRIHILSTSYFVEAQFAMVSPSALSRFCRVVWTD